MKILVFSDLHGNLSCLKKLIKSTDFKQADKIIFLGDVIFGCSRPNKCIELLKQYNIINIVGNNDLYVSSHIPKADLPSFNNDKFIQMEYMANNVTEQNKAYINTWPKQLYLSLANKTLYFCHYALETIDGEESVMDTPNFPNLDYVQNMFKNINADYFFFGHEHKQYNFCDDKKQYFCLDTIGLKNPGNYIIISDENNEIEIIQKQLHHNLNKEIKLMDKAKYPYDSSKITSQLQKN